MGLGAGERGAEYAVEGVGVAHRQKEPLRLLSERELMELERVSRSDSDAAVRVARAKVLVAVSRGVSYSAAARLAGRRSGQAVAYLVSRFNREGLAVLDTRHGGGKPKVYRQAEEERILREVRRCPDRERDGTSTWSLNTLQRALRRAPDGLPTVSTWVIGCVLHGAGYSWQKDQSWCETGQAIRKRKGGNVQVRDPDAGTQKN
jgi:transposase